MKLKRGMVMLFVIVLMASLGAILICCADLSRIAELRQHSVERASLARYFEDTARTIAMAKFRDGDALPYDLNMTMNGETLNIRAEEETGWMGERSIRISWSANVRGKELSSMVHSGKRTPPPPVYFGLWVKGSLNQTNDLNLYNDGALYLEGSASATGFNVTGDAYTSSTVIPNNISVTGVTYTEQANNSITFNTSKYDTAANKRYNSNQTLTATSLLGSTGTQPLIYVNGNLTLSGTYNKNFTLYVNGELTVNGLAVTGGARAVLICTGNVFLRGTTNAFVICAGNVGYASGTGKRIVYGGIICSNIDVTTYGYDIHWDNYFYNTPGASALWKIPGSW